jgi:sugar-specific transcriptional regulator TrmB
LETHFSKLQVLRDLGLTSSQAKIYLALLESGTLRISAIAKLSDVPRPDVYRNLSKLHETGLVEKIIRTPVEYRALPMKKGLSLLLETKTRQYETVKAETQVLLDTAKLKKRKKTEQPQFVLIPKGKTVISKIRDAIEKAESSIDLVLSWKRFSQGISSTFDESMEIAWRKNVKTRFIIGVSLKGKTGKQLIQFCREKPFCQVRFISRYPETVFGIYDKKEVFIIAKSETDLPGSAALWSKNRSLISLAENYFEMLWLIAMAETKI